ncbi:GNAT family N-acetyltransferase [Arthrospiribacter ruber]|uniref:GNAT family N-acetyltransferase n=1 Tax=Arthrospiribacter ruber TaxID=2487934 RepID=A0A951IWK5_9BACT|nr:GNAT family N-acetyltransferase [Arthrospiribacter ruber]MBW3468545.1 GNAT family N-acetyltransferase [Arthrospiribacter ruber]
MNYTIRPCEEKDLPELIELCAAHAAYEKSDYDPEGKMERLREAIFGDIKRLNCWIVDIDGKAQGFTTFTFDFSTWDAAPFLYMDCLYLDESCRGLGIGAAIMDKIREVARENNCKNIQWQTPEFNARAIKFYVGLGSTGKQKMRFFLNP